MTDPNDHESLCAALYAKGAASGFPLPDGFLVMGADNCMLCKNSMRNNGYPSAALDGTPITWLSTDVEDNLNRFYATPGITYDYEKEAAVAAGQALGGVPFVLWVEGGAIKRGALKFGEIPPGGFEALREKTT